MIEIVRVDEGVRLEDYGNRAHLINWVRELRSEAAVLAPRFKGRRVWMVNSTAEGGGVAEMLPKEVDLLRELGVDTHWLVIKVDEPEFFALTKRIHNAIHGYGDGGFSFADREVYEKVSHGLAKELRNHVREDDFLVVHDPQPLASGAMVREEVKVRLVWRCHIGLDEETEIARRAWGFLKPFARDYHCAIFSAPEYIPSFLAGKASVVHPAIDPLSHKNRELVPHKLVGILCNAGLQTECHPVLTPRWDHRARRLQSDGEFAELDSADEIGLLYRPIVTQVSRWDRLKGWQPLMEGFLLLKRYARRFAGDDERFQRLLSIVKLVLAGPDPGAIQDDPEAIDFLDELRGRYLELSPEERESVAVLSLPMASRKENALMVNALQRCSTVVVQNSLREGFGLTATEAMWKAVPVLGTNACGLRRQIRDRVDGMLTQDPENPEEIAHNLATLLADPVTREKWGHNAQRHCYENFLVFNQVAQWMRLLSRELHT